MATSNSETAKTLFFEALALMDSSNFRDAEPRLREALKLAPGQIAVLTNLSIALVQQNKRAEAQAFAEQALAINPTSIEALLVLADCHVHGERFADAVAAYDRLLVQEPRAAEIHNNRGNALHRLKRYDEALAAYEQALALSPTIVGAWLGRANVLFDLNRPDDALAAYGRTLALKGDLAQAWLSRGNALSKLKRHGDALSDYERAATLQPDLPEAWLNRGNALCDLKRHDDALAAFDKALALHPTLAAAWLGRGNVFYERKDFVQALAAYDRAVTLDPTMVSAWVGRGDVLRFLERTPEAIAAYRQALAFGADTAMIDFYLAGLGVGASPATSPQQFVTGLFDNYADNFEHDLVKNLNYHSPEVLAGTIMRYAPPKTLDILDLGCGTGLMGNLLRPRARTLTGVDLSANMLEKARQRRIYDRLVSDDITAFLPTQDGAFDLAVATDVFIYVGDLAPVFPALRRALRPDGLFCFSVEAADGDGFVLRSTLRYAHSIGYLRRLAAQNRFNVEMIEPQVIRRGVHGDIDGYHIVMRAA
ncbi:MAG: tetratricopeptide repeat protein [Xanthobacteraceae bacterium]|nr:tetratricopeptide repeat protein [Xanthobacteraceae bacterium]